MSPRRPSPHNRAKHPHRRPRARPEPTAAETFRPTLTANRPCDCAALRVSRLSCSAPVALIALKKAKREKKDPGKAVDFSGTCKSSIPQRVPHCSIVFSGIHGIISGVFHCMKKSLALLVCAAALLFSLRRAGGGQPNPPISPGEKRWAYASPCRRRTCRMPARLTDAFRSLTCVVSREGYHPHRGRDGSAQLIVLNWF